MRAPPFLTSREIVTLITFLIVQICPATSRADIYLITSRAAINNADIIEWSQLGPAFSYAATPHQITSFSGGVTGTLYLPGQARRLDQGNGWAGDFLPGEPLIYTWPSTPITLFFDQPLAGVGMQIEQGYYGAFTSTIQAFDAGGTLLGSFERHGMATSAADGSAIFIGVWSDDANIQRLVVNSTSLVNGRDGEFAINFVSVSAVPEPATTALLGLAVIIAGPCRLKPRRHPSVRLE
jgi:hypothetical protein